MSTVVTRWRARRAIRAALLAYAQRQYSYWYGRWRDSVVWNLSQEERSRRFQLMEDRREKRDLRREQVDYADRVIARHTAKAPNFKTAAEIGLSFDNTRGNKGDIYRGAGHHSAGAKSKSMSSLVSLARAFHRIHKEKGGGGLAYEALVNDNGDIVFGNPAWRKSDGVARSNTGLINICVPGTTGDRMTEKCKESIEWLMDNWHTDKVPAPHRIPQSARTLEWRGHREWFNNSACPGTMLADYKEIWK